LTLQDGDVLAEVAGEAIAFALRQPPELLLAERPAGDAAEAQPGGVAMSCRGGIGHKNPVRNEPRNLQRAESPAAERRQHARLVLLDVQTVADTGPVANELQQRAVAEIDDRAPQAMA